MGLEQVKEEILAKAKAEADIILAEAKTKANEHKQTVEKTLKTFKENSAHELKLEIEAAEKHQEAAVHLEEKKVVMNAKKQILQEVYDKALAAAQNFGIQEKKTFFKAAMKQANAQMDIGIVYCNARDKEILGKEVKTQTMDINGLIVENKDTTQRLDFTYASVMERTREKTLQDVAKLLF